MDFRPFDNHSRNLGLKFQTVITNPDDLYSSKPQHTINFSLNTNYKYKQSKSEQWDYNNYKNETSCKKKIYQQLLLSSFSQQRRVA